jgi:hypothetical protein
MEKHHVEAHMRTHTGSIKPYDRECPMRLIMSLKLCALEASARSLAESSIESERSREKVKSQSKCEQVV